jgi:hypothetical protein
MSMTEANYLIAGICVLAFLAAQAYQHLAYASWIPAPTGPDDELRNYLLPVDRVRALLVGGTILALLVPYAVLAIRYSGAAPVVSVLGLVFGAGFVGLEVTQRSIDFFVVGEKWARQMGSASDLERLSILRRFALWNELTRGWYFPLLLTHLLASVCFLAATWTELGKGGWFYFAPVAFALNALRLAGRIAGTYAGVAWLEPLNRRLYFPAVLVINLLLTAWFFYLATHAAN